MNPRENFIRSEKGKTKLGRIMNEINSHIDSYDRETILELSLFLLTAKKREEINPGIFKTLLDYSKKYLDQVYLPKNNASPKKEFDVIEPLITPEGDIRGIRIGDMLGGSLYCSHFSDEEIEKNKNGNLNYCGSYPTMDQQDSMFLSLGDKLIVGDKYSFRKKEENRDNLFFGPYYFNRQTIGLENASLTKLAIHGDQELEETITSFDEQGRVTLQYQSRFYLEEGKSGEYHAEPLNRENQPSRLSQSQQRKILEEQISQIDEPKKIK